MTRFKPVPRSPNAVSSRADEGDRQHYIAPLTTTLDKVKAEMAKAKVAPTNKSRIYNHITIKL